MIEPVRLIDDYLYNADKAARDNRFELRRLVTLQFAEELYKIHKVKMDQI